eukprot:TRINITY_DN21613_c0_g1_i1.p1 TRINITY_DN21613_c0_g1~~TRINITY_DN21613_c0_g1_i1.p1  ORF type:complete len:562 (-),score=83.12 TRINITY_DN21613_c0_g1_i1:252-1937(-)
MLAATDGALFRNPLDRRHYSFATTAASPPERSRRGITLAVGLCVVGATAAGLASCPFSYWLGPYRWLCFALTALHLAAALSAVVHALVTRTDQVLRDTIPVVTFSGSLFSYFILFNIFALDYTVLCGVFIASALSASRRVTLTLQLATPLALALCASLRVLQGSTDILRDYRSAEMPAVKLLFVFIGEFLAPLVIAGTVSVLDHQLQRRHREVRQSLALLARREALVEEEEALSRRLILRILPREITEEVLELMRRQASRERGTGDESCDDQQLSPHTGEPVFGSSRGSRGSSTSLCRSDPRLRKNWSGDAISYGIARSHESATVLFADIVGFTAAASRCEATALVAALSDLFTRVDTECLRLDVEKIKTIGDCYFACCLATEAQRVHHHPRGPSSSSSDTSMGLVAHGALQRDPVWCAERVVRLSHVMHRLVETGGGRGAGRSRSRGFTIQGTPVRFRCGVHSGPLVSGVIGLTKLSYDLWGETVNCASRLESGGVPGCTVVSQQTHDLLQLANGSSESSGAHYAFQRHSAASSSKDDGGEVEAYLVSLDWPPPTDLADE